MSVKTYTFDNALEAEIARAKERLEEQMRGEAAKVGVHLSKYFDIITDRDHITIKVSTKGLSL